METKKKYPIPSGEQEDIEEALTIIWNQFEHGERKRTAIFKIIEEELGSEEPFQFLLDKGYLHDNGGLLEFTSEGKKKAEDITRRHRLAERLLTDVLSLDDQSIDANACQLEHIISPEVAESICTLLGHPKECPHGSSIPGGPCCARNENQLKPIVVPLSQMKAGEDGLIAYVLMHNHPELHKLLSLGVVPGAQVHLHQTRPAFVVQLDENQLALEEALAKNIFIRRK